MPDDFFTEFGGGRGTPWSGDEPTATAEADPFEAFGGQAIPPGLLSKWAAGSDEEPAPAPAADPFAQFGGQATPKRPGWIGAQHHYLGELVTGIGEFGADVLSFAERETGHKGFLTWDDREKQVRAKATEAGFDPEQTEMLVAKAEAEYNLREGADYGGAMRAEAHGRTWLPVDPVREQQDPQSSLLARSFGRFLPAAALSGGIAAVPAALAAGGIVGSEEARERAAAEGDTPEIQQAKAHLGFATGAALNVIPGSFGLPQTASRLARVGTRLATGTALGVGQQAVISLADSRDLDAHSILVGAAFGAAVGAVGAYHELERPQIREPMKFKDPEMDAIRAMRAKILADAQGKTPQQAIVLFRRGARNPRNSPELQDQLTTAAGLLEQAQARPALPPAERYFQFENEAGEIEVVNARTAREAAAKLPPDFQPIGVREIPRGPSPANQPVRMGRPEAEAAAAEAAAAEFEAGSVRARDAEARASDIEAGSLRMRDKEQLLRESANQSTAMDMRAYYNRLFRLIANAKAAGVPINASTRAYLSTLAGVREPRLFNPAWEEFLNQHAPKRAPEGTQPIRPILLKSFQDLPPGTSDNEPPSEGSAPVVPKPGPEDTGPGAGGAARALPEAETPAAPDANARSSFVQRVDVTNPPPTPEEKNKAFYDTVIAKQERDVSPKQALLDELAEADAHNWPEPKTSADVPVRPGPNSIFKNVPDATWERGINADWEHTPPNDWPEVGDIDRALATIASDPQAILNLLGEDQGLRWLADYQALRTKAPAAPPENKIDLTRLRTERLAAPGEPIVPVKQIPTEGTLTKKEQKEKARLTATKRKRLSVGLAPNGEEDLLSAIQDAGGLPAPSEYSLRTGGEYDDLKDLFSKHHEHGGLFRLLLNGRWGEGAGGIDNWITPGHTLWEKGYNFETVGELADAMVQAAEHRAALAKQIGHKEYSDRWEQAFLGGDPQKKYLRSGVGITVDDLKVGDVFTVNGEEFYVKHIDEAGNVTVQDGLQHTIGPGERIFPDRGIVHTKNEPFEFFPDENAPEQAAGAEGKRPESPSEDAQARAIIKANNELLQRGEWPDGAKLTNPEKTQLRTDRDAAARTINKVRMQKTRAAEAASRPPVEAKPVDARQAELIRSRAKVRRNSRLLREGKWPSGKKLTASDRKMLEQERFDERKRLKSFEELTGAKAKAEAAPAEHDPNRPTSTPEQEAAFEREQAVRRELMRAQEQDAKDARALRTGKWKGGAAVEGEDRAFLNRRREKTAETIKQLEAKLPKEEPPKAPRRDFKDAEDQRAYLANKENFDTTGVEYPGVEPGTPLYKESQERGALSAEVESERVAQKLTYPQLNALAQKTLGKKMPDLSTADEYRRVLTAMREKTTAAPAAAMHDVGTPPARSKAGRALEDDAIRRKQLEATMALRTNRAILEAGKWPNGTPLTPKDRAGLRMQNKAYEGIEKRLGPWKPQGAEGRVDRDYPKQDTGSGEKVSEEAPRAEVPPVSGAAGKATQPGSAAAAGTVVDKRTGRRVTPEELFDRVRRGVLDRDIAHEAVELWFDVQEGKATWKHGLSLTEPEARALNEQFRWFDRGGTFEWPSDELRLKALALTGRKLPPGYVAPKQAPRTRSGEETNAQLQRNLGSSGSAGKPPKPPKAGPGGSEGGGGERPPGPPRTGLSGGPEGTGTGGFVDRRVLIPLARAAVGGFLGSFEGDTDEERMRNALIGAGMGAIASPAMARWLVREVRKTPRGEAMADRAAELLRGIQLRVARETILPKPVRQALQWGKQREHAVVYRAESLAKDLVRGVRGLGDKQAVALGAKVVNDYLNGQVPLTAVPLPVRVQAERLRNNVDELIERLVQEGVVSGDLANTVAASKGKYLRRSYEIFMNPRHRPPKWKVQAAIKATANELEAAHIAEEAAKRAKWQARSPAQRAAQPFTPWNRTRAEFLVEAEKIVAEMLDKAKRSELGDFLAGRGKIAGKDVSSLIRRKDLLPEIRDMLGEVKDPAVAAVETVSRMARLLEIDAAQKQMAVIGQKLGIFSPVQSLQHPRPLVAIGSETHDHFAGLYAKEHVAEAMRSEMNGGRWLALPEVIWKSLTAYTAAAKAAHTILNPPGYSPNFAGGMLGNLASGNFHLRGFGRGLVLGLEDIGLMREFAPNHPSRRGLVDELAELRERGVIDQSPVGEDLVRTVEQSYWAPLARKSKALWKIPAKLWSGIDNLNKYVSYRAEQARYAKAYPNMPKTALQRKAGDITRKVLPTYSEIPSFVKQLSIAGLAPTFVNFSWEAFRNVYNIARIGMSDLKEGRATGNTELQKIGAKRLAALAAVLGFSGFGLVHWLRKRNHITDDQDKAAREFSGPWNKDALLAHHAPVTDGVYSFSNTSYVLPHAVLFQAIESASREHTPLQAAKAWAGSMIQQFTGDSLVLGPLVAALSPAGVDPRTGRKIQRTAPTPTVGDRAKYLYNEDLEPGVITEMKDFGKALRGESGKYGKVYTVGGQIARQFGWRVQTVDVKKAVFWRARELGDNFIEATRIFRSQLDQNLPPEKLRELYDNSEAQRREIFDQLKEMDRLARVSKVEDDVIVRALRESGIGAKNVLAVLDGEYLPGTRDGKKTSAEIVLEFADKNQDQRREELAALMRDDPRMARNVVARIKDVARGVTERDRLMLALPTENGERAAYIAKELGKLATNRERLAALNELKRKDIATAKVIDQIFHPEHYRRPEE